jgi:glycosyltransferase involved in cell wall biosynthesis
MRIGIDLRLLSGGGLTVHRGMGRYTLQQLREVLRQSGDHEVVLFCREDADMAALPPEVAGLEIAWLPPLARDRREMNRPEDALRATEELQRAIDERQVDAFHLTTPCDLDDFVPCGLDGPLVATHYDLIPAVYPRHYYQDGHREPERRALYERALRTVRGADRLVAISRHSAREATAFLGVPAARIRVAYPVADPGFRPLPEDERERILAPLRERLGLPGGFLLSVSHLHHAKNLRGLFDAWRLLPAAARRELPLVLACELHPADEATVRAWAEERGIADGLILTGFLADEELVALYNAATVYVHPSRSEGFGLPVLEAMRCGAAVAAADSSSLPEVVGEAGVLFDPEDPAAIARAVEALWLDPGHRRELGKRAVERAALFRAEDLGRETLAAYEEAAASRAKTGRAPRLALWTPVPPQESGISDYSLELLRELVRPAEVAAQVEVFTDDGMLPAPEVLDLAPVRPWPAFARRDRRRPFDAVLYQLGASFFHFYMDEAIRTRPGIVTLHDLTWGALLHRAHDVWGDREGFRQRLEAGGAVTEYDALLDEAAGDPAVLAARLEDFLNRHPLLGGIMANSLAAIVHLPRAATELEERYGKRGTGARVYTFPMGIEDPRLALPANGWNDLRPRLGIAPEAFVAGVFGVADPVKRLEAVVRAVARLAGEAPQADPVLIIAGGFPDPAYRERVEALAAELGIAERVRLLGRTSRRDFDLALLACDAVVNLRYPFRHQMSATLMRAIAAGKPVLITDVPSWDHFPAAFCLRVAPDEGEVDALTAHLAGLARDPARRREMGEAARRFWSENATPSRMAGHYRRVLSEAAGVPEVTGRPSEEPDLMSEPASALPPLRYDKAGAPDDFADPVLAAVAREVFPHESERFGAGFPRAGGGSEHWRGAMAVRALRDLGALGSDAEVLCVGAGAEMPVFHLTGHVRRVTAVDRYLSVPFARERLTVQAMDGRVLWLPDDAFAGIYAPAVERLGTRQEIAAALFEMGRVLAPGGILALSASLRVAGPADSPDAAPGTPLSADELRRWVIAASGLEPVDEPDFEVPETTLTAPRRPGGLVAVEEGNVTVPVALALRKTGCYPSTDNAWARPSEELREKVRHAEAPSPHAGEGSPVSKDVQSGTVPQGEGASPQPSAFPLSPGGEGPEEAYRRWDAVRARTALETAGSGRGLTRSVGFLRRTAGRVRDLGSSWDRLGDLLRALLDRQSDLDRRLRAVEDLRGLEARIAAAESELSRLRASAAEVRGAIDELRTGKGDVLRGEVAHLRSSHETLYARQETLRARQARVEGSVADLREELGTLQSVRSASGLSSPSSLSSRAVPLTPGDLAELLAVLDDGTAGAVEVSFQDVRAESLLLAARRHFGGRLSSSGPSYRSPNDLWLHIDFTSHWNRPILLENAAARLALGGRFLLITAAGSGEAPQHPEMRLEEDRKLALAGGTVARVIGWRR